MGQAIQISLLFITQVVFSLYAVVIILRVMLRKVHADCHNPLVHAVVKLSSMPVKRLKLVLPDVGKLETASLLLLVLVIVVKGLLVMALSGVSPSLLGVFVWAVGNAFALFFQVLFYLVIIRSLLSWLPAVQAAIQDLVTNLTDPIMAPARKYIPLAGGLDLSPIAVLIVLQVLIYIIANPIMSAGINIATG